jgi:hypothetical protein
MSGRPSIFISHSSKRLAGADRSNADPAKVARLDFAADVRDDIYERLNDIGTLEAWLDQDRIEPGDEWRAKLHTQLARCHGAVLLLGEDSLASNWVRTEATILVWRRLRSPSLRIVPVLLGATSLENLETSGWGPLELTDLQFVRADTPDLSRANRRDIVDQVVDKLRDLEPREEEDADLQRWIEDVQYRLRELEAPQLRRVAELLNVAPEDWNEDELQECRETLAIQLLASDLTRALPALRELVALLRPNAKELVENIVPIWVDLEAARAVLATAQRPPAERFVAVGTRAGRLGQNYVQRAVCCSPQYDTITVNPVVGEAMVDELVERYVEAITMKLALSERQSPDEVLRVTRKRGPRCFVLVRRETVSTAKLASLLGELEKRYSGLTFVILSGSELPASDELGLTHLAVATPPLLPDKELDARRCYSEVMNLINRPISVDSDI